MARSAVDVVVPVAGDAATVRALLSRLSSLPRIEGDTVTVVDNRGVGVEDPRVVVATAQRSSYYARNRGAERGRAPWILFLDADVVAAPDHLDRLLATAPGERVGVLAGAVADVPPEPDAGPAVRWAWAKGSMSQEVTLGHGRWAFAQTANCAVRRSAFEAVGGFAEGIRSGGDADLCWRLREAGWALERRPGAVVVHHNRTTVRGMLRQRARHGSGAAWLGARWPGALPARRWPGLLLWGARRAAVGVRALARGDRDAAAEGLLDGPAVWAFELGRLVPNRAPAGTPGPWRRPAASASARRRSSSSSRTTHRRT
ncbi:glycosyltransferase family 2 protein [Conexibacter sp. SYSU D00693]|uniref:glycosyltransferase family 2 protein n=1 Tax=Conexibacter sp. SYSU D00693 TaxID=2812560 RepID=UPI00196AA1D2|nr:glycosyltransferase family 2 protein [Conexibacter sp. SYSU D00693]